MIIPVRTDKPLDYHERRRWQDAARAKGEMAECGRMACTNKLKPGRTYVNAGTPLLYCPLCAREINRYSNPPLCTLEVE